MKNSFFGLFVSLVVFFLAQISFAAPMSWAELTYKAITQGARYEAYAGVYRTLSLNKPLGDSGAYEADHFSAVGGEDAAGKFRAGHYETVSEQWNIDANGNWDIDQWLFKTDLEGRLTWVAHFHLIEMPNGTVIEHRSIAVTKDEGEKQLRITLDKF